MEFDKQCSYGEDTMMTISDVGCSGCQCDASRKLIELIKLNHHWHYRYNSLFEKYRQLREVEKKNEHLKRQLSESKDMLRSFEEASYLYSTDDFEIIKEQLISYKHTLDKESSEKQRLLAHNRQLELKLQKTASELDHIAMENSSMKLSMENMWTEKVDLLDEIRRLVSVSSENTESVLSVIGKSLEEQKYQDTSVIVHRNTLTTDTQHIEHKLTNCRVEQPQKLPRAIEHSDTETAVCS